MESFCNLNLDDLHVLHVLDDLNVLHILDDLNVLHVLDDLHEPANLDDFTAGLFASPLFFEMREAEAGSHEHLQVLLTKFEILWANPTAQRRRPFWAFLVRAVTEDFLQSSIAL